MLCVDGLEHLPTFFQKRMAYIKFTHVISPSCGYIQMQSRIPELREMEAAISAIVDNHPHLPYTETRAGIALACLLQEDRNREAMWVRAILKYPVPNVKLIKVNVLRLIILTLVYLKFYVLVELIFLISLYLRWF